MRLTIDGLGFEGTVEEFAGLVDVLNSEGDSIALCCNPDCLFEGRHPDTYECSFDDDDKYVRATAPHMCACLELGSASCVEGCCVCNNKDIEPCSDPAITLNEYMADFCKKCFHFHGVLSACEPINTPSMWSVGSDWVIFADCPHEYVYDGPTETGPSGTFTCRHCGSHTV